MEYNSGRPKMIIPEYGRHIQKMIDHATNLEDKAERNKCANAIITVMGQLNPHLRDVADFKHKLWDHLFIMSNFNLDVESPYEKPSPETFEAKPDILAYPQKRHKNRHYGKIIEDLINKAIEYKEGDEKNALIGSIANLMKRTYLTWNSNSVNDEIIMGDLKAMSQGKLSIPENFVFENTADILARNVVKKKRRSQHGSGRQNYRGKKRN